jgi:hypothetical protein
MPSLAVKQRPGQHQPAEAHEANSVRMPSVRMKAGHGRPLTFPYGQQQGNSPHGARPGGPGQHKPAEAGQGKVGTMPSLAVK